MRVERKDLFPVPDVGTQVLALQQLSAEFCFPDFSKFMSQQCKFKIKKQKNK